jgi:hypothetical protein
MSYCTNCSHTLEIVKNIDQVMDQNVKIINKPEDLIKNVLLELEPKKKKYINMDIQYSINFSELVVKNYINSFDKKNLEKYNIKFDEFKTRVLNKFKEIVKKQRNLSTFILQCSNCGSSFFLQPETIIYSINYENSNILIDDDTHIKCNDLTLPRTKDFICPNPKCINNTDSSDNILMEKEAVFFRNSTEYNLKYICCQCHFQWGT